MTVVGSGGTAIIDRHGWVRHSFIGLGMLMLRCTPALWGEGVFSRSSDIFLFLGETSFAAGTSSLPADDTDLLKKERGGENKNKQTAKNARDT